MSTDIHTLNCTENAEALFREECAQWLTAQAWDAEAMIRQWEYVRESAAEWLLDGTASCICEGRQRNA